MATGALARPSSEARQELPRRSAKPTVLLWADTFNNHFLPSTAIAAAEVLEAAGFEVKSQPSTSAVDVPSTT